MCDANNAGVGDVKEIVTKYDAGIVIDDFSQASFDEAIHNILSHEPFDRQRIREGAREVYALNNAIERYRKVYETILN